MQCDKCGGSTKEKTIISTKPATKGNEYTVLECLNGCRNGKFAYTFFPPKERKDGKSQPQKPAVDKPAAGEAVTVLRSIDISLKNILNILQTQSKMIPVQSAELQPDEEVPF